MPVIEHPVHPHGIRDAEHRYGCHNRAPLKEIVTVEGWRGPVSWPFAMSRECRYDKSLSDTRCSGCKHAGSGEAYIEQQNHLITESQHAN